MACQNRFLAYPEQNGYGPGGGGLGLGNSLISPGIYMIRVCYA